MVAFDRERFDADEAAMLLCTPEGSVLEVNASARSLLAYSLDRLQSLGLAALAAGDDELLTAAIDEHLEQAMTGETVSFEWELPVGDRRTVAAEIDVARIDDVGGEARLVVTVVSHETAADRSERLAALAASERGALGVFGGLVWALPGASLGAMVGAVVAVLYALIELIGAAGHDFMAFLSLVLIPLVVLVAGTGGAIAGAATGIVVGAALGVLVRLHARLRSTRAGDRHGS